MTRTVFYAWQSDSPSGANRGFIREALDRAVQTLNDEGYEVAVDEGTAGIAGMPDISTEILRKIDQCAVFVADVTLVGSVDEGSSSSKRLSNPSVMYELGYARNRLGENRLVALVNTVFGRAEDLPFDIKGARVSPYRRHSPAEDGDTKPKELSILLHGALKRILDENDHEDSTNTDVDKVSELKRMLPDASRVIEVEDLMTSVTENLVSDLNNEDRFPLSRSLSTGDPQGIRCIADQAHRYVSVCLPACELLATGIAFGKDHHDDIWRRTIERVANTASERKSGNLSLLELRRVPTLMLGYSALIAGVHRGNYSAIRAVLVDARIREDRNEKIPAIGWIHPWVPFEHVGLADTVLAIDVSASEPCSLEFIGELIRGSRGRRRTPGSDFLHEVLREPLRSMILDDEDYTETFDKAEVLLSLFAIDAQTNTTAYLPSPAYGSFAWRYRHRPTFEQAVIDDIFSTALSGTLLAAGLFAGQEERLQVATQRFLDGAKDVRMRWF